MRRAPPPMPGTILKLELDARGWTQKDLAAILGRPQQAISEIVRGTKRITPDTALELAAALGTPSAQAWLYFETEYRLSLARSRKDLAAIVRRAAVFSRGGASRSRTGHR